MAIGNPPVQIGSASSSAAVNTIVITTTVAVAAGSSIIVPVTVVRNAGPTSIADSVGNTYAQDVLKDAGSDVRGAIYSAHNVTALPSGGTITITVPNAIYTKTAWAISVTGLAAASTKDKTVSSSGTSGAWSSGATATLSQADEIGFALAVYASTGANTPNSGWTELIDVSNAELKRNVVEYQIVASTSALTAGGTFPGGSALWGGMLATYKAATGSVQSGSGTLSGASSLSGSAGNTRPGAGSSAANSSLAGAMAATFTGKGTLNAASSLSGGTTLTSTGAGAASSQSSLSGAGSSIVVGGGGLTSTSSLSGTGARTQTSGGSLSSLSNLTGLAVVAVTGEGSSLGTSTLAGHGGLLPEGSGALDSSSSLQGAGVVFTLGMGSGSLEGSSSMSGAATRTAGGYGSLASVTTLEGTCVVTYVGAGGLSSTTIMAGSGASLILPGPAATGRMDDARGHIATTRPGRVSDSPRGRIT